MSDDDLARAILVLLEQAKVVVEPAGAAGVAAILEAGDPIGYARQLTEAPFNGQPRNILMVPTPGDSIVSREPLWDSPWLWGAVVGLGSGMAATVLGAAVVNRWFTERRGLVMGALTAGTATGQLIFLPALAKAVELHGWRTAMWIVAGATAVILFNNQRQELTRLPGEAGGAY